jgi:hypothetical protein
MSGEFRPVPPSLLFFLFAHRLGVPGHATRIVPCNDDYGVQLRGLSSTLLASAFWGLREAGLARLEVERKSLIISRHTYVKITLLEDSDVPGLEGQLLAAMHRNPYEGEFRARLTDRTLERLESAGKQEEADRIRQRSEDRQRRREEHLYVERVVLQWFGGHYSEPDQYLVEAMREIAVSFGYMDVTESESAVPFGLGGVKRSFQARCDRIVAVRAELEETLVRWSEFRRSEPALYKPLVEHCERGVRNALRSRGN